MTTRAALVPAESIRADFRTSASHTIGTPLLAELLAAVPADAPYPTYVDAIREANVLGRPTVAGRHRTLRHLRELYLLDPTRVPFRALRDLWAADPASGPLLTGLLAFTRDAVFRTSFAEIANATPGSRVSPDDLAAAVGRGLGGYRTSTLAKCGRNTAASWTQTGHLSGRRHKVRAAITPTPASLTYALLLGYLDGARGRRLLESPWTAPLEVSPDRRDDLLAQASHIGFLSLRSGGGVLDISFPHLLRGPAIRP